MRVVLCMIFFLLGSAGFSRAQLRAGDVAVVAYNTVDPDSFAWVTFRDIPANTPLQFTNSSVSNGWFRWGDHLGRAVAPGPLTWVSSNVVAAGTVISWISGTQKCWSVGQVSGGSPALSMNGDQLFVYQGAVVNNAAGTAPWLGDASNAVLLYGLNFANAGWDNVNGGGPNTSFIPPGLRVDAGTAVHVDDQDNGYFAGPWAGSAVELLAAIATRTNWITGPERMGTNLWASTFGVIRLPCGTLIRVE